MTHLEVWYARIEVRDLLETMASPQRKQMSSLIRKSAVKDHLSALDKLTTVVDGRRAIVDDPPLVMHVDDLVPDLQARLMQVFSDYRQSLGVHRRELFDRYRLVDFARKVVGVGSVGTRCWAALFQGPNGGPLFLQVKEARQSVISIALGNKPAGHFGQRVVDGQRSLQAASDVMLGWATDGTTGEHYFMRQLCDSKWSADVSGMGPFGLGMYAGYCG